MRIVLAGALFAWFALAAGTIRDVGIVGEVAIGWALPSPPVVLADLSPPAATGEADGWLRASRTRPVERAVFGDIEVPLAVNAYTGGAPDWPARAVRAVTGSVAAGAALHVVLGGLLLLLAHRFLVFHGTRIAAGLAAWILATDWCFQFYRKALGGTEILLQAAGLLVLWALWSRRWKGGVHGTVAIALGVGLGLGAKATFAATLAAFGAAMVLTRWDHPALKPPRRVNAGVLVALPLLCVSPLAVAWLDAGTLTTPPLPSHDTLGLQLSRLWAGWSADRVPARESAVNLMYFFGDPRAFFAGAYGAEPVAPLSTVRTVGFLFAAAGVALEWRDKARTAGGALLRFLSFAVPLQIGALWLANHDLHHLAQATVPLALLCALGIDRLAATTAPPRSLARAAAAALLAAPLVIAGARQCLGTDRVLATVRAPTFTESGQAALVDLLRANGVRRLVASDYELYGMLEARAPEIAVTHTWAAVARGARGPDVLRLAAADGWYLSVRPSAPMIYDWSPDARKVARAADEAAVRTESVATLGDPADPWATLWRVSGL